MRKGGFATVEMILDGKTLFVLNREANVYGQSDMAGTIDTLIDALGETYQRPLPAADLLTADAGAVMLADVTKVLDLGSGVIRGEECDHLAFRNGEVDWQIWISQSAVPHPCRFVITSTSIAGWPEYTLEFSAWGKGALQPAFTFEQPASGPNVEIPDVSDLDEVGGFSSEEGR